jgi:hypothetical protein
MYDERAQRQFMHCQQQSMQRLQQQTAMRLHQPYRNITFDMDLACGSKPSD